MKKANEVEYLLVRQSPWDNEKTGLALATLYSSSLDIHINRMQVYGLEGMLENVDRVLSDHFRFKDDQNPVKFEYVIKCITGIRETATGKADDLSYAMRQMVELSSVALEFAIRQGHNSVITISCNEQTIKEVIVMSNSHRY